jgi:hypothetical protein
MVNPHYPKYYRGERNRATDDEDPIPNYFPAVEAGSAFGFAVLLNRTPRGFDAGELLGAARGWVERALTEKGAGAKTAAGYGWFGLDAAGVASPSGQEQPRAKAPEQREVSTVNEATLKNYIRALMNPGSRGGTVSSITADLKRDATFGARIAAALAKRGKEGKRAIEWLKTKGVNLT